MPKLYGRFHHIDDSVVTVDLELPERVGFADLFNLNRRRRERRERQAIVAVERRLAERRKTVRDVKP